MQGYDMTSTIPTLVLLVWAIVPELEHEDHGVLRKCDEVF